MEYFFFSILIFDFFFLNLLSDCEEVLYLYSIIREIIIKLTALCITYQFNWISNWKINNLIEWMIVNGTKVKWFFYFFVIIIFGRREFYQLPCYSRDMGSILSYSIQDKTGSTHFTHRKQSSCLCGHSDN